MPVRTSSAEAYHSLKAAGKINDREHLISQALLEVEDATSSELYEFLTMDGEKDIFGSMNNVATRLSEMRSRGLVQETGHRNCGVTGRMVIIWAAVLNPPADPPKAKKMTKEDELTYLRKRVKDLEQELAGLRASIGRQQPGDGQQNLNF